MNQTKDTMKEDGTSLVFFLKFWYLTIKGATQHRHRNSDLSNIHDGATFLGDVLTSITLLFPAARKSYSKKVPNLRRFVFLQGSSW